MFDEIKTYIAIDLKSFYASVECVERGLDPLSTNLVVADNRRTEKTICLAITPSLKAYGLSGRSRLFEVIQKAKEIKRKTGKELNYITAIPRMSLYIKYSADIYEIYLKFFSADDIHVYSIDEVFIDVTSYLKLYQTDAKSLCKKVLTEIHSKTGITATAGIAPNLFLCKVAMDIVAKHIQPTKNGAKIASLDELEFRKTLWNHRPLTDFWRIGPGTARRLEKNFMFTLGDVARRSLTEEGLKTLYKTFGIDAEILIDHAWGIEPCTIKHIKEYKSEKTSVASGQVLHQPYNFEDARLVLSEMIELLSLDLMEKQVCSSSFTMIIGFDTISIEKNPLLEYTIDYYGRKIPLPAHATINLSSPTNLTSKILTKVLFTYDKIVNPKLYIRRINICANNVIHKKLVQTELFDEFNSSDNTNNSILSQTSKEEKIQTTILKIQKKFGKNSMFRGHDLQEGATTIQRNNQIGGHNA